MTEIINKYFQFNKNSGVNKDHGRHVPKYNEKD